MNITDIKVKVEGLLKEKEDRKATISNKIDTLQAELDTLQAEDLYKKLAVAKTTTEENSIIEKMDKMDALKVKINRLKKSLTIDEKVIIETADFEAAANSIDFTELEAAKNEFETLKESIKATAQKCINVNRKYQSDLEDLYNLVEGFSTESHIAAVDAAKGKFFEKRITDISVNDINFDDINNTLRASSWV